MLKFILQKMLLGLSILVTVCTIVNTVSTAPDLLKRENALAVHQPSKSDSACKPGAERWSRLYPGDSRHQASI